MTEKYERMKKLLEGAGIKFTPQGISNAEIYSYACGLEFVHKQLRDVFKSIFINCCDDCNPDKYIEFLNIDTEGLNRDEIKKRIAERMSEKFGDYTRDSFEQAFERVGSGSYFISDDGITFKNVAFDDLERLGRFIESYVYAFTKVYYDGSGLSFDEWDERELSFEKYNSFNLPFRVIDNLRSDAIEQYE